MKLRVHAAIKSFPDLKIMGVVDIIFKDNLGRVLFTNNKSTILFLIVKL